MSEVYIPVEIEAEVLVTLGEHDITEGAMRADLRKRIVAALETVEGLELVQVRVDRWIN